MLHSWPGKLPEMCDASGEAPWKMVSYEGLWCIAIRIHKDHKDHKDILVYSLNLTKSQSVGILLSCLRILFPRHLETSKSVGLVC